MKYTNPRTSVLIEDYPIGGSNRGKCKFELEHKPTKGYRATRTTTNKHGVWCKPKLNTYGDKAVFVDGEDGRTYLVQRVDAYRGITVSDHAFMRVGTFFYDSAPEICNALLTLIAEVYKD